MTVGMTFEEISRKRRARALELSIAIHGSVGSGSSPSSVVVAAKMFDDWILSGTVPERTKGATVVSNVTMSGDEAARVREALEKVGLTLRERGVV